MQEFLQQNEASAVYLTGEGFHGGWMKDAAMFLCRGRRVFQGENLFSKGAAYSALLHVDKPSEIPDSIFLAQDALRSNIGIEVLLREQKGYHVLLDAGVKWYNAEVEEDFILENGKEFSLLQTPVTGGEPQQLTVRLDGLPDRKLASDLPTIIFPVVSFGIMMLDPPVGLMCLLASLASNMITYFRVKGEIEPYLSTFRYVLRLLACGKVLSEASFPHYDEEKEVMKTTCRSFDGFTRGSGILLRGGGGISSGNPADILLDYVCILFHIDLIKFGSMLRDLRGREKEIDALITAIGSVDAQISVSSWRKSLPVCCTPEFTDNGFDVKDLVHPLLDDPVPNSLAVSKPVLLTGSNASGKSTFLKAAALAAVLAQSLHTVPASSYRSCCYRVYTSMALRDDIRSGESYFIVEIRSLKRVLDAAAEPCPVPVLCCIDEVLRGTNTIERISASAQILATLAEQPVQIFAATHDMGHLRGTT